MKKTSYTTQRQGFPAVNEKKDGVFRDWLKFEQYRHYDWDLEAAVIGICYLESDSMAKVRRFLIPEMFYYDFHQVIWRAMCKMFDENLPIDMITVVNYIAHNKEPFILQMEAASQNWYYEFCKLAHQVVSNAHLEYHAHLIREQFIERHLLVLTTQGMGPTGAHDEMVRVQQEIDNLLQYRTHEEDWQHISTVLIQLYQHMEAVRGKDIVGTPSGFPNLDKVTGGFSPGLYYLGARPSTGKTALALRMILSQAAENYPVGIISLETRGIKLAARVLSMISSVDYWRIYRNKMSDELSRHVYKYNQALSSLPIYISDKPAVNIVDIKAKTYKLMKEGAQAIYIDFIQLVEPEEGAGNREQEVAKLSRGLKLLSMQVGIPIIALAQLNRESERAVDKTPRLIHLRESGSIEQDADGVMLLHRPEKVGIATDEHGDSTEGKATLIIAKWKDGETFDHPMLFNGDRMEFTEDLVKIEEKRGWRANGPPATPLLPNNPLQGPNETNLENPEDLPF